MTRPFTIKVHYISKTDEAAAATASNVSPESTFQVEGEPASR